MSSPAGNGHTSLEKLKKPSSGRVEDGASLDFGFSFPSDSNFEGGDYFDGRVGEDTVGLDIESGLDNIMVFGQTFKCKDVFSAEPIAPVPALPDPEKP